MNEVTRRCRELRNAMTDAEFTMWQQIRRSQLGVRFVRQKPLRLYDGDRLRYFIADFCCIDKKLVIEIDGKIHESQREYDEMRTMVINSLGFAVVRFSNDDVMNNMADVISRLREILPLSPSPFPHFVGQGEQDVIPPAPRSGEGVARRAGEGAKYKAEEKAQCRS